MVYLSDNALLELEKYRLQVHRETGIACDRSQAVERLLMLPCPAKVVVISETEYDCDESWQEIYGVLRPEKAKEITDMYPELEYDTFTLDEVLPPYDKPPAPMVLHAPRPLWTNADLMTPETVEQLKGMIAAYEKNHPPLLDQLKEPKGD